MTTVAITMIRRTTSAISRTTSAIAATTRRTRSAGPDPRRQKGSRNGEQQRKRRADSRVVEEAVPAGGVDDQIVMAHGRQNRRDRRHCDGHDVRLWRLTECDS